MTSRDPGDWRLPRWTPRHAAPFGFATPLRWQAHKALRLFVTTGSWAAGLCLVIGLIVLVASASAPGRAAPRLASARQADASDPAAPAPAAHVLATFTGRGNRTTPTFTVRAHDRWQLRWSYRCPGHPGQLIVADSDGAGTSGASIDQTGIGGTGSTWLTSSRSRHYLIVISTCSWTMKAVQAR